MSAGHKLLIQLTAAEDATVCSPQTLRAWRRVAYIAAGTRAFLASDRASGRCRPGVGQLPLRDARVAVAAAGGVLYAALSPSLVSCSAPVATSRRLRRDGYSRGVVKLRSGGRVTIPAEIRKKLDLCEGDELRAEMVYGGVLLRVDSLANDRAVRGQRELARLGWRGLWRSQVPIVQILGRGGLIAIVLLVLVVSTLAEKRLSNLLTLLAAVNLMIIPIMRGEPPLTIGYFRPNRLGAWLEKRLSQPEITCATASLILIFSYFIAPFSDESSPQRSSVW